MTKTITLAHSPDADDLVMWWPLAGMRDAEGAPLAGGDGRPALDTHGFAFEPVAADIQALNERATSTGDLDITAISAFTYPFVQDRYRITACGGSFGDGYGPKVVVRQDSTVMCEGCLRGQRPKLAVPGDRTTAFCVLSVLMDGPFEYEAMPFQEITGAVAEGRADAGVLIHEAQLTHAELGLREVADLGAWWKQETGLLLPLGLNVIRRDLDERFGEGAEAAVAGMLTESVAFARAHPEVSRRFLLARVGDRPEWRDDALVERYLGMYVNNMTTNMGQAGRAALTRLFDEASRRGLCPPVGPVDLIG